MDWTQEEIDSAYAELTKKVAVDKEFRQLALSDANKAIEQLAGKTLPEGVKMKIIEQDPAYQATLVLPPFVGELSEEELAMVAGGRAGGPCEVYVDVHICWTRWFSK